MYNETGKFPIVIKIKIRMPKVIRDDINVIVNTTMSEDDIRTKLKKKMIKQ